MGQVAKRVEDKRLLKLIRAFLNAGVMENGLVSPSVEGTPQGGPLSPLLSNLVLDELDRELERRGHRYLRYADDCNIYVRSQRAGQRVMESITRFITQKLKLKVNETKSAVARPQERKLLGFSFSAGPEIKRIIAPKALDRFKQRIREITRKAKGVSIEKTIAELTSYIRGWRGYCRRRRCAGIVPWTRVARLLRDTDGTTRGARCSTEPFHTNWASGRRSE
jgi:RNA-directed DNA polymerase